ncbi:MAG: deoxyribodipyrimidine photo-lyase [Flavobacteriales bacterium]|nr:deoxyribodipyrimidine photo-lyase [Flavobacteriales bacterium]
MLLKSATPLAVCWLRRDLKLHDNAALFAALKSGFPVLCVFIFDTQILKNLPRKDARVLFIHRQLALIKTELESMGSTLITIHDTPLNGWKKLCVEYSMKQVFAARDYEPYAQQRDHNVFEFLASHGVRFIGAKDHVIFEKNEVIKDNGTPYTVFTPYSKQWKEKLNDFYLKSYPTEKYFSNLLQCEPVHMQSLFELGFEDFEFDFPAGSVVEELLSAYSETRDVPSMQGTSRMSLHLRFGTVSIRKLARLALKHSEKYLDELIWREFYQMILYHFPETENQSFKKKYDRIRWLNNEEQFALWCAGKTGYPLVDAGMRELNETGFMHNRVRMVVASFLTKHLLIDWRWGERYFAEKLLDFDLASNVGGWQWAAGCGCDAAPYFRIFNPTAQQEKFDPEFLYIKKWLLEWGSATYPKPIVEHAMARERCLRVFKEALA